MKRSILSLILVAAVFTVAPAQKPSPEATAEGTVDGIKVKIVYSAPSAKGRKIFGGLEAYGKVWRTGANNATVFETDKAAKIEGQLLPAGKYELFTIPGESEWTIIFQKFGGQWGAFKYDEKNDVLRVKVKAAKTPAMVETFVIAIDKAQVTLQWENTSVAFSVKKG